MDSATGPDSDASKQPEQTPGQTDAQPRSQSFSQQSDDSYTAAEYALPKGIFHLDQIAAIYHTRVDAKDGIGLSIPNSNSRQTRVKLYHTYDYLSPSRPRIASLLICRNSTIAPGLWESSAKFYFPA